MNDQPFLHAFSNMSPATSHSSRAEDGSVMSGQVRKRFRRGAAQIPAPVRDSTAPPVQTVVASPVVTRYPATSPIRDEWDELRLVPMGVRRHFLSGAPLVNFFRRDPAAQAFDLLRTRLLQTLRANGWSRIAIAAPTQGCGSTFTAVNLAQSLARIPNSRTVLMDLNHRNPDIARTLGLDCIGDTRRFLAGEIPLDRHLMRASKTLALGLTADPDPDAAEILHNTRCGETLERMTEVLHPDVVLYDLPPILAYDDLVAFLPQVDGVLLVADATQTLARHIAACEQMLDGQTQVLGVILNRARRSGLKEYQL